MTRSAAEQAWASLADDLEQALTALQHTAAAYRASFAARPAGSYSLADLTALRPRIHATLDAFGETALGTGIVVAPGILQDAPYWLEWWWRQGDGAPEALRVNLDPAAPDFYDYASDEWFEVPVRSGKPHVTGPYVDYACANRYTFTLSVPVYASGQALGIIAMDIPSDHLEQRIMPALCAEAVPRVLLNSDRRVIAASAAGLAPGDRLGAHPQAVTSRSRSLTRLCSLTGWMLAPLSAPASGSRS